MTNSTIYQDFNPLTDRRASYFMPPAVSGWDRFVSFVLALATSKVRGADLSHHNGIIDPKQLWDSGIRFVFLKVTESTNFKDPMFNTNFKKLVDYGFLVGGYHFMRANVSGRNQADWFLSNLQPLVDYADGKILPCMLDSETRDGQTNSTIISCAGNWFNAIGAEHLTGEGLYTSPYLWGSMYSPAPSWADDIIGWLAHWTSASSPSWPSSWNIALRKFWQYGVAQRHTWVAPIRGTQSAEVDANWFLGTWDELKKICGYSDGSNNGDDPIILPPWTNEEAKMLNTVLLKNKLTFHNAVTLTGSSTNAGQAITISDLPENVKGLKVRVLAESDKQDAFVFFGPGQSEGPQKYHIGVRIAYPGAGRVYENNGDVLLDGKTLWRYHQAHGGSIKYWLIVTGYLVDAPEINLQEKVSQLEQNIAQLRAAVEAQAAKNTEQDGMIFLQGNELSKQIARIDALKARVDALEAVDSPADLAARIALLEKLNDEVKALWYAFWPD